MGVRFRADSRGVSEVVGAVLLLGILMLTLSIYQVSIVPNQNAATEFQHNQQVEDEMVDVRNAILEARSSGKDTFASVTLGTRYQDRTLTVNPPLPTGTIQTVEQPNFNVTETGGDLRPDPLGLADRPLENQFVEYSPRYYEYDAAGTMRYENTIAYHDYGDAKVSLTNQTLLRGETISLIPLAGTFRKDGIRRVAVEPMPGVLETVRVEDPNVTVPTELSEEDWRALLGDEIDPSTESVSVESGNLTLSLDGIHEVAYAPIGLNRIPTEGDRGSDNIGVNPAGPGEVSLTNATLRETGNNDATLVFENTGEATNITAARISFFFSGSGSVDQSEAEIIRNGTVRGTLPVGGNFEPVEPEITIPGNTTSEIRFVFGEQLEKDKDWFIFEPKFKTGDTRLYFVSDTS